MALGQAPDLRQVFEAVRDGILPAIAATLLLFGIGGRRWLGLAIGASVFGAYAALVKPPAWPLALYAGDNDGSQWWMWSVVACGLAALPVDERRPPPWVRLSVGALLLAAEVWFMLTNQRLHGSVGAFGVAAAIALLIGAWLGMRRAVEYRDGMWLAGYWGTCLLVDAKVLFGSTVIHAQLAGTVVAALATAFCTALWQRPFRLGAPTALAVAAAHGGLLLAGVQFASLRADAALFAGLAPAALALAGPPGDRAAAMRFAGALVIGCALLATAIWRSTLAG